MKLLLLNTLPSYVLFTVQATKGDGAVYDPSADSLDIYEEDGADGTFSGSTVTGSPFDPVKLDSKTGFYGVLVPKSVFTSGKFYLLRWTMTIDGISSAYVETYIAVSDSRQLMYLANGCYNI